MDLSLAAHKSLGRAQEKLKAFSIRSPHALYALQVAEVPRMNLLPHGETQGSFYDANSRFLSS